MNNEWTFTHVGAEANKILMNVIKKSQVKIESESLNKHIILPSSNDNLSNSVLRQSKKSAV